MLIVSLASPAEAQPSDRFPAHITVMVEAERYQAFDLGGFQELLRIDSDLVFYQEASTNLATQVRIQDARILELEAAQRASTEIIEVLQAERTRLVERWTEENRLRLDAENGLNTNGVVGWVFTAALAVVSLVLGGVVAVQVR